MKGNTGNERQKRYRDRQRERARILRRAAEKMNAENGFAKEARETVPVPVRLPLYEVRKIRTVAQALNQPVSRWIRDVLTEHLTQKEVKRLWAENEVGRA
jgi:hypothetical protein